MVETIPCSVVMLLLIATLWRGRLVRAESGVSAWAFWSARGPQRVYGALFAGAGLALFAATLELAIRPNRAPTRVELIGAALTLLGSGIAILAQRQMQHAWRVGVRVGDAPLLIEAGLFRHSRNPIFAGMCVLAVGVAFAQAEWWTWLAAFAFALACHLQVKIEEAHLAAAFGDDYIRFCERVPRWVL